MPNRNGQKPSLLTCGPMLSDMPTMPTMQLHCYHTLRDYHPFSSSQELKFKKTQIIGNPLVDLLIFSMKPFTPPSESTTNVNLGPKLECTWDYLPYTTMSFYWFSTATLTYSAHNSMCAMNFYSQLPKTLFIIIVQHFPTIHLHKREAKVIYWIHFPLFATLNQRETLVATLNKRDTLMHISLHKREHPVITIPLNQGGHPNLIHISLNKR